MPQPHAHSSTKNPNQITIQAPITFRVQSRVNHLSLPRRALMTTVESNWLKHCAGQQLSVIFSKSMAPQIRWQVLVPFALSLFLLLSSGCAAFADIFSAQVVSVVDGDTINVLRDGARQKVILYGVDCPELTQDFGQEAKKFTDDACYKKTVNIEEHGQDQRGRIIGVVLLPDGTSLNRELVRQGLAWWSDKYAPTDATLKQLHEAAKTAHTGLWAGANPIPPWIFRNGDKGVQATVMPKH
jgi:micrococcal nuclease